MAILSDYARKKKIDYFLKYVSKSHHILEIGCADGWVGDYLKKNGFKNYLGLDLYPPADIIGDIKKWRDLGIKNSSFDVIIAFEVVEHVDCFNECHDILKKGGKLMITTPIPHMDWMMKILESVHLNQKRTSSHTNLVYLNDIPNFSLKEIKKVGMLSQWAIFTK